MVAQLHGSYYYSVHFIIMYVIQVPVPSNLYDMFI